MPRYYFHLREGAARRLSDESGLALPDAEAAWYQAVRSGRELLRVDVQLGCSWEGQAVEIEDDKGLPVGQIPLQEIVQFSL